MNQNKKELLEVKVRWSPVIGKKPFPFRGEVEAVSSQNPMGNFDILPGHINFITLIFNTLTIHTTDQKKVEYQFARGILEVSKNKVNIFLGL